MKLLLNTSNIFFFIARKAASTKGGEATKEKYTRAKNLARQGRLEEIDADIYIKHYTSLVKIQENLAPVPEDLPFGTICGWWYWGPTGTGKSHQARLDFPGAYLKVPQNKWWCGYKGEECVIIEDFDQKDDYMGKYFKQWVDRLSFRVEIKGGGKVIRPKYICITSNWSIDQIWKEPEILDPLLRRFHQHHFTRRIDQSRMPYPINRDREADCFLEERFRTTVTRGPRYPHPEPTASLSAILDETQVTLSPLNEYYI